MPSGDEADLDELIGRVDPDRWLTSRFIADAGARMGVLALYAFDHELARARRVASNPLMAEIRLTWWREVLDEIFAGRPVRRHPVAQALAKTVKLGELPREPLEGMIDGQIAALDAPAPDIDTALRWADAVEGSLADLAAKLLDPDATAGARASGRAWGLALLIRGGLVERGAVAEPLRVALRSARAEAKALSPAALPAALPARLARYDLAGDAPGPLRQRLALTLAVATGRV